MATTSSQTPASLPNIDLKKVPKRDVKVSLVGRVKRWPHVITVSGVNNVRSAVHNLLQVRSRLKADAVGLARR